MSKYYSIVEGDCEKSICQMLKQQNYIFGKIYVKAIQDIKRIDRVFNMIDENSIVTVIMDTDVIGNDYLLKERLTKNIKYLIENSKEVIVITENKNLEDELIRSLPNVNSHKKLFEHFSNKTKDGYKKRLAQMPEERLSKKLEKLVFTKFWSEKVLESYTLSDTINVVNKTLMDVHKN